MTGQVVPAAGLSVAQLDAIGELERACAADGRLKLEWNTLRSRSSDDVRDYLFVTDGGETVGFLGLYQFGPGPTEISGMVHPDHRRQGIFSRLLDASEAQMLTYESAAAGERLERLLLANRQSDSGRAFALARGGVLEHSEYEMVRGRRPVSAEDLFRRHDGVTVRSAVDSDRDVLSAVLTSAFPAGDGTPIEVASTDGLTAIELDGATIGMLRVEVNDAGAWISGFAIAADQRGRGFGHQVLEEVVRDLDRSGVEKTSLDVATDNERALGLYLDLGFEQVGAMDYFAYAFTAAPPGAPRTPPGSSGG